MLLFISFHFTMYENGDDVLGSQPCYYFQSFGAYGCRWRSLIACEICHGLGDRHLDEEIVVAGCFSSRLD